MNIKDQKAKGKIKEVTVASRWLGYFAFERSLCLLVLFVALAGAGPVTAQTRVYAHLESNPTVYPGQPFTYAVVVEGGSKPTKIDIAPIAHLNPQQGMSGRYVRNINGRSSVSYHQKFVITPTKPGKLVLPGLDVVVDGKTYTTNPVEVTVSEPGTTDKLELTMSLSEKTCYVGQPVVMTVTWIIKSQVKDPTFDVPAFKSDDFYFEDVPERGKAWASQQAEIHGVSIFVKEERKVLDGAEAAVISFSKALIPKRAGTITLDPTTISVDIMVGRVRANDIFNRYRPKYERVSVQSAPAELNVLPLPEKDKPAGFYGLVGGYTISATAAPTEVSAGDPITLTIEVGGNSYLEPVQWPDLEAVPALANNFKIPAEKASPVVEDGRKVFTQTIRANSDDVTEVPPIPLAFFDPKMGRYTVTRTDPIPLEVAPTKVLTTADVEGTTTGTISRRVEAVREGFSANYYGPEVLVNQEFSLLSAALSPSHALLWSVPLLGLVVSAVYRLSTRTSPEAVARKRRRHACATAVAQLKAAASTEVGQRHDLIVAAMKGYLGDRFDRTAGSLTADDCHDLVANVTEDPELAQRFKAMISEFEAARYASMDAKTDSQQVNEMIELIRSVQEKSKR